MLYYFYFTNKKEASSLKTTPNNDSVSEFLGKVIPKTRSKDGRKLTAISHKEAKELSII
jgi:hypothetical protein